MRILLLTSCASLSPKLLAVFNNAFFWVYIPTQGAHEQAPSCWKICLAMASNFWAFFGLQRQLGIQSDAYDSATDTQCVAHPCTNERCDLSLSAFAFLCHARLPCFLRVTSHDCTTLLAMAVDIFGCKVRLTLVLNSMMDMKMLLNVLMHIFYCDFLRPGRVLDSVILRHAADLSSSATFMPFNLLLLVVTTVIVISCLPTDSKILPCTRTTSQCVTF